MFELEHEVTQLDVGCGWCWLNEVFYQNVAGILMVKPSEMIIKNQWSSFRSAIGARQARLDRPQFLIIKRMDMEVDYVDIIYI